MSLESITPGQNPPEDINVIIEIPAHADPVKYEVDKDSGVLMVDRFMATAMHYPCNYGYVPRTLCGDGDPVDVLVVTPLPLLAGAVVRCRPIGVLQMTDEAGEDAKLLAVPLQKLTAMYDGVNGPEDLPRAMLDQISHFFEHYKDLEPGKWVKVEGWQGPEGAQREIIDSIERYGRQR